MTDWVVMIAALVLLLAAAQDLIALKISNYFSIALLILFGIWIWQNVGLDPALWQNLTFALAIFAAGAGLFAIGWFGGGDVKLMAAAAIWFDWQAGWWYLAATMISGGIIGLMLIFGRRVAAKVIRQEIAWPALKPRGPIPYGIAIATGAILVLLLAGPRPVPNIMPSLSDTIQALSHSRTQ
jgi:prepilin peptidase CpaA